MPRFRTPAWSGTAILLWSLAWLSRAAFAHCLAPDADSPSVDSLGRVSVSWQHPICQPDTVRAFSGQISQAFYPGGGYPIQAIALKLDDLPPGTHISRLRVYYLMADGTSIADWVAKAGFAWSLHYDSTGYPGSWAAPVRFWPLGDHPILRGGGWYEDTPGWEPALDDTADLWVVGTWLEDAPYVVRMGSDGRSVSLPQLVGAGTTGIEFWASLPDPGLLVEFELQYSPSDPPPEVVIIRDFSANPLCRQELSPWQVDLCLGNLIDSTIAYPESVRYGFITVCETDDSDTSWTAATSIPKPWPVAAVPESLHCAVAANDLFIATIALSNSSPVDIEVTPDEAYLRRSHPAPDLPDVVPDISVNLTSAIIPAGSEGEFEVMIATSSTPAGAYSGAVTVELRESSGASGFRLGIPVQVIVDQQTSVGEAGEQTSRAVSDWQVSAGPNPFTSSINLRAHWDGALIVGAGSSSLSSEEQGASTAEVTVYNVLGQAILREQHALDPMRATQAGETTIRIEGTHPWPAGVYICRITLAGRSRAIKLLHVK